MKRLDRARIVRDDLLARASCWETTRIGDKDFASLEWREVNALLHGGKDFSPIPDYSGIPEILANRAARCITPYALDVWVRGLRVLSISWNARDEVKLLRMTRGEWECDYFHLPAPNRAWTIH